MGIVEVLGSSEECNSSDEYTRMTWELSGVDHPRSEVQLYVASYVNVDPGIFEDAQEKDARASCRALLRYLVFENSSEAVHNVINSSRVVQDRQGMFAPLWSYPPFPDWSPTAQNEYNEEWNATLEELQLMNDITHVSFSAEEGWVNYAIDILDILATARLAYKHGYEIRVVAKEIGTTHMAALLRSTRPSYTITVVIFAWLPVKLLVNICLMY